MSDKISNVMSELISQWEGNFAKNMRKKISIFGDIETFFEKCNAELEQFSKSIKTEADSIADQNKEQKDIQDTEFSNFKSSNDLLQEQFKLKLADIERGNAELPQVKKTSCPICGKAIPVVSVVDNERGEIIDKSIPCPCCSEKK